MIDDLVTKGVDEPYRMFTSRAEYRILLRQDNADLRLTEFSYKMGLAKKERFELLKEKIESRDKIIGFIKNYSIAPEEINHYLNDVNTTPLKQKRKLLDLVLRPQVRLNDLINHIDKLKEIIEEISLKKEEIIESAEVLIKYSGYIEREQQMADKLKRLEYIKIPKEFNYDKIFSLSTEGRQKLKRIRPKSIGQAARISGVSPSDIGVLLVYMGR